MWASMSYDTVQKILSRETTVIDPFRAIVELISLVMFAVHLITDFS